MQGYLIGAVRNQVRRQQRDARKTVFEEIEVSSDSGEYLLEELGKKQELAALRGAILNLPVKYREIIVLCDLEGMEYDRAAEQLGCAVGTVRSRLHRAEDPPDEAAKAGKMSGMNHSSDLQTSLSRMLKLLPTDASARTGRATTGRLSGTETHATRAEIAASALACLVLGCGWLLTQHLGHGTQMETTGYSYIGTADGFVPLPYAESGVPLEDAVVVRVRLRPSELGKLGVRSIHDPRQRVSYSIQIVVQEAWREQCAWWNSSG